MYAHVSSGTRGGGRFEAVEDAFGGVRGGIRAGAFGGASDGEDGGFAPGEADLDVQGERAKLRVGARGRTELGEGGAAAGLVGPGFEGGDAAEGGVGGDARGGAGVQGAELGGDSRELPRRDHARLAVHSERRAERRVALHHRPGVLHERQRRALRRVRGGGGSRV